MGVKQEIASQISVHPAGYHTQPHLPGRPYWASLLWAHNTFAVVKSASKLIVLLLKCGDGIQSGFKKTEAVSEESF